MRVLPFRTHDEVDAAVPTVSQHLRQNGLIAYPTETVYGLGSKPDAAGLAALARLKKRPPNKPFLLLVSGRQMAEDYGLHFTTAASALARAFWPGPLTLVLAGGESKLADALRGPEGGIAVRWTGHKGIAQLITALGFPISSTSANRPGGPTAPGVGAILRDFGQVKEADVLLVLDGGVLGNVPPSTLVECMGPQAKLIREGAIPRSELRERVGKLAP